MDDENSKSLTDMVIDLAINSALIVTVDEPLFAIYTNSDDFKKGRSDRVKMLKTLELLFGPRMPTKMFIFSSHPMTTELPLRLSPILQNRLN